MAAKRISIKGLAEFMTSGARKQQQVIRGFKYPDEDEARAKITYYRDARDLVKEFHRSPHEAAWLHGRVTRLREKALISEGRTKTRLQHNARALSAYSANFGSKNFVTLPDVRMILRYVDVTISVVPDIHVREGDRAKILKLDFDVDPPNDEWVKIFTQTMYEAATAAGLGFGPASVLYVDVSRGLVHKGARLGSRMKAEVVAACENISALWDRL